MANPYHVKKKKKPIPREIMLMRSEFARIQRKLDEMIKIQYECHSMFGQQIEEIYQLVKTKGIDTAELVDEIKHMEHLHG